MLGWWNANNVSLYSTNTVQQATSYGAGPPLSADNNAIRPTLVSGRINFVAASTQDITTRKDGSAGNFFPNPQLSAVTLPDGASGSTAGIGFTCTGIALANDGTWWLGNYGKPAAPWTGVNFAASLVHLSADFKTFLGQITFASLGITQNTTVTGPQGVAFDTSDNTLWMACPEIGNIYHVSTAGALLSTLAYSGVNGLAYDPVADQLVASTTAVPNPMAEQDHRRGPKVDQPFPQPVGQRDGHRPPLHRREWLPLGEQWGGWGRWWGHQGQPDDRGRYRHGSVVDRYRR